MNKKSVLFSLLLVGCFITNSSQAQIRKLRSLASDITMSDEPNSPQNIERWKYIVDEIISNPETSEMPTAYGWRAIIYNRIFISQDSSVIKLCPNGDAAKIAGVSAVRFYQASKEDQDMFKTKAEVEREVPNIIISCYNVGNSLKYTKGQFSNVETYMTAVCKLIDYDTASGTLAINNGVSPELATLAIWQSAYTDTLIDKEIIYLEKLAAKPRYFNYNVFVRLSQIYADRKDYTKAMDYLNKGMEKIPQRSSVFIQQQINIEMERGNQEAIITKFNTAIANEPENATYYFSRGVTYHQLKLADVKKVDASVKSGNKIAASFWFSQALSDYNKCLEIESGNPDALYNLAILYRDSADVLYKEFKKIPPGGVNYNEMSAKVNSLYKVTLEKLEGIRQSGQVKDQELIFLLEDMRACARRIGDIETSKKYDAMVKEEKAKLQID